MENYIYHKYKEERKDIKYMYQKIEIPIFGNMVIDKYLFIPSKYIDDGYLHLLEHMIIRNNFDALSCNSIEFNGFTTDVMSIEIMSHNGLQLVKRSFLESDLNIEKKLIKKERLVYSLYDEESNRILGTLDDIESFNINNLYESVKNLDVYHIIYSSQIQKIDDSNSISFKVTRNQIKINGISVYIFEIINNILNDKIFSINYYENSFSFMKDKKEKAIQLMHRKEIIRNIFTIYYLNLSEYRVLDNEICTAIQQNRFQLMNILKIMENINWEKIGVLLSYIH